VGKNVRKSDHEGAMVKEGCRRKKKGNHFSPSDGVYLKGGRKKKKKGSRVKAKRRLKSTLPRGKSGIEQVAVEMKEKREVHKKDEFGGVPKKANRSGEWGVLWEKGEPGLTP